MSYIVNYRLHGQDHIIQAIIPEFIMRDFVYKRDRFAELEIKEGFDEKSNHDENGRGNDRRVQSYCS